MLCPVTWQAALLIEQGLNPLTLPRADGGKPPSAAYTTKRGHAPDMGAVVFNETFMVVGHFVAHSFGSQHKPKLASWSPREMKTTSVDLMSRAVTT